MTLSFPEIPRSIAIVALALLLSFGAYLKGCADGRKHVAPAASRVDTVRVVIPPIRDSIAVNRWRVLWAGRDTVYADRLLREIDTLLVRDSVRDFVACADSVIHKDTISVCYSYARHAFDFRLGFAPRAVAVPAPPISWIVSHYVAGAEIDLDRALFVYGGMEATIWASIRGSAHVGIRSSNGLAANARAGVLIIF